MKWIYLAIGLTICNIGLDWLFNIPLGQSTISWECGALVALVWAWMLDEQ